jgi:hypothetical protein
VVVTAEGHNFDGFESEGLHHKHAITIQNLGNISVFARKPVVRPVNYCLPSPAQ